ncbi:myelin-associated glycoprotein-like [Scyliorhinus canicula]|uniref:myelin-associated glycoprotein-like n=1 Tax=Scyliorhinus canicula TaxID=7830 RepID=UPI0018F7AC66|nr:myelin-associated glycoprotein-like [Scyliorhinus canicula]
MFPVEIIIFFLVMLEGSCGTGWDINLSRNLTGQEELCVVIPCRYQFPNDVHPTQFVGIWFKQRKVSSKQRSPKAIYNSSSTHLVTSRYRMDGGLDRQDCSLVINDLHTSDHAYYQFQIELDGRFKFTYEKLVHLQVSAFREIPTISHMEEMLEGKPVNLICTFLSHCEGTRATLSWLLPKDFKRSTPKTKTERRNATWAFTIGLTFTPTIRHQDKQIGCQVKLSRASSKVAIRLQIEHPPRRPLILREDRGLESGHEGSRAALLCSVNSQPAANLTWIQNGERLNSSVNSNQLWLLLPHLTYRQEGEYRCTAWNKHGTKTASEKITIQYSPKETSVRVSGTRHEIREGDNVTLTCFSKSNPPVINYSWFRVDVNRTDFVASGKSLNLGVVSRDDNESWHYCRAENELGPSNSSLWHFNVEYGAEVVPQSNCTQGVDVECVCVVTGNPPANITWELEHKILRGNYTESGVKVSSEVRQHEARSTLTVKQRYREFNAVCVGSNRHGEKRLKLHLCPTGELKPLWFGVFGRICGAFIAAAITASVCWLLTGRAKKVTQPHQRQVPPDRDASGSEVGQDTVRV